MSAHVKSHRGRENKWIVQALKRHKHNGNFNNYLTFYLFPINVDSLFKKIFFPWFPVSEMETLKLQALQPDLLTLPKELLGEFKI